MARIQFTKMSGAGNDFVVVDHRTKRLKDPRNAARILCDRHEGVGADGLLLLERSTRADFRMMYYNADGSYGGMCGNGGRCIAWFAFSEGIAPPEHRFEALGHVYRASIVDYERVALVMKDPRGMKLARTMRVAGKTLRIHTVDTGSPHAVVVLPAGQLARHDVVGIGRLIRAHRVFRPKGVNANFIERTGRSAIKLRTYERGVEAETLSCGTGSIASALVANRIWAMKSPVTVHARSGERLRVGFSGSYPEYHGVILEGPARVVFVGETDVPA